MHRIVSDVVYYLDTDSPRESQHRERHWEPPDYGPKLDYDPQWKGPLQIERVATDLRFLVALTIFVFVWIGVGIYAFRTGDINTDYIAFYFDYFYPACSSALPIALGFTIFGLCLAFVYFFLLRYFPKTIVVISVVVNLTALLIDIILSFRAIAKSKNPQYRLEEAYDLFISIILVPIILIMLCVYHNEVLIACRIFKESTDALVFFPSSFLLPIIPVLLGIIATAFAASTMLFLSNHPEIDNEDFMPLLIILFHLINFFGYLWVVNFLYAYSQMVLSGAFATWYWSVDRNKVPKCTISKFIYITTRFHLGTLAFGSWILSLVSLVKFLAWLGEKTARERNDPVTGMKCCCCIGCLDLTEDCLEYINTNAYIMCILHGKKFIRSAIDAFHLLKRNIMKVIVVVTVTMFILFLGTLLVVGLSALATYAYCRNMDHIVMYTAVTIVFLTTSAITGSILGILNIAIHTIFLSVLEDYERNDGSHDRPYFMTHELKQLLIKAEQTEV